MVELAGVCKRYGGDLALEAIDLVVPAGSTTVLLGPSGCGKSTLLQIVGGLESPSGGQIRFADGGRAQAGQKLTSMVFQEYALFPWRTVVANVVFGPEVRGLYLGGAGGYLGGRAARATR